MTCLQPNDWSCLPTAFAMALDVEVQAIIDYIGHDGSEVWWPELREPKCRRSFHIQEMVDFCLSIGKSCSVIFKYADVQPTEDSEIRHTYDDPGSRFMGYIRKYKGILINPVHAVYWDREKILDPNGYSYVLPHFACPQIFCIINDSQS